MMETMQPPKQILLVEDDVLHKELISRAFEGIADMVLFWVDTLDKAKRQIAQKQPDLVIADWRLTDGSGIDLITSAQAHFPVILMTSYGNEELAVRSMKAGVADYLVKSPEAFENLPNNARRALREWDNILARQKAERALRESEERYRLASEGANDVIWDYDPTSRNIYFSGRWIDIFQIKEGVSWCTYREILRYIHPDDRKKVIHKWKSHLSGTSDFFTCEYRIAVKNCEYKWIFARGKALYDADGVLLRFAGSLTDITENKQNLLRIEELAYFDPITGLPNRVTFNERLEDVLCDSDAKGLVFFIDVDYFNFINDTFGHSYGDRCLAEVARMLKNVTLAGSFLCRYGADEFIMLLDRPEMGVSPAALAQRIMDVFKTPLHLGENSFYLTVSVGVASYPTDGTTADELLKHAHAAMHKAKTSGRNTYKMFDHAISNEIAEKTVLGTYLRSAMVNKEFLLHYQPKIDMVTGRISGLEALIRWNNPQLGMVSPLRFIRLAEEMGLIVSIGYWVLQEACDFAARLYKQYPELRISVNLSSVQLMQTDFVDKVKSIIEQANIPPQMIGLEITESLLMESFTASVGKLDSLKEFGMYIELDDFGTGYSSLSYLKNLPIHAVKIDKSFIDDISETNHHNNITEAIIKLAHMFGLSVVAEGVETQDQARLLTEYCCDTFQGYFASKPLPEEDVKSFLKTYKYILLCRD